MTDVPSLFSNGTDIQHRESRLSDDPHDQCQWSVAFGGEDLTDIYSAACTVDNRVEHGLGAGALLRLQLGMNGVPDYCSRIGL